MAQLTDPTIIRRILDADRAWALYALGDLSPELFPLCDWYGRLAAEPALILRFRGLAVPVLFALGAVNAVSELLAEAAWTTPVTLSVRPETLPAIRAWRTIEGQNAMWRMLLDPSHPSPQADRHTHLLGWADLPDLERLYADGHSSGEAPDAFVPEMLARGVFAGIREGEALIAAAGTHLVAPGEGVAALGSVYTRRDRRGRGLAGRAVGTVVRELRRQGISMIGLNVADRNSTAQRVYAALGFRRHCAFYEGVAAGAEAAYRP